MHCRECHQTIITLEAIVCQLKRELADDRFDLYARALVELTIYELDRIRQCELADRAQGRERPQPAQTSPGL